MDYFDKRFDSTICNWKLTGCDATSFAGLEKHADDAKDDGQYMAAMCLITTL